MEVNELIKYISDMSIIDKLKLGISVFSSNYIMSIYQIYNNKIIMFLTVRILEYSKEEQNKVAMYLVNSV